MSMKLLCRMLAAMGFVGFLAPLCGRELLQNPSFELGSNVVPWNDTIPPTGWQKYGNWGWAGWKNNRPAHTGDKFVDAGAWTYGQYGVWYQDVLAEPNQSYACAVWARTEGWGIDPHASLRIEFRSIDNQVLRTERFDIFSGLVPSPNDWTRYVFTTSPAPAGTNHARFMLRGEAQCTAMFDDVSMEPTIFEPDPDYDDDGVVALGDFVILAQAWLGDLDGALARLDLNNDGELDAADLTVFSDAWLTCDEYVTIEIDETVRFQEMDGFGASITESSAVILRTGLGDSECDELMRDLFDPNAGIGLSYLRQPMGSSDFRLGDYTYDDMPPGEQDYELEHFTIGRDREHIIPLLRQALEINPRLNIMGTPWSAPAWMKDSGQLGHGRLISSEAIYQAYAQYFVKFVQAYAAEGIPIDAVTLQNEPHYQPYSYPGMRMGPQDEIQLAICVGRAFEQNGIHTKIIIWDHNWDNPFYAITVLSDPQAYPYIAGTAFHCYGGDVSGQLAVFEAFPEKGIYFTECSGGAWAPVFGDNLMWDVSTLVIGAVRNHAKTVLKWNLALDPDHGPKLPGGCEDCRGVVTVDPSGRIAQVTREVEYYSLGHAAKFVVPGAHRIDSTEQPGADIGNVAFANPDGSLALVVANPNTFRQNVRLVWRGRCLVCGLAARSVTTFRWPDEADARVEVWVTTGDGSKLLQEQPARRFYSVCSR